MFIILVNGASGSGKTTIVRLIKQQLSEKKVEIVSVDQFYKSLKPSVDTTVPYNWDHIDAIDVDHLIECICSVKNGKDTLFPSYDYVTHQTIPDDYTIEKVDVLIVEGIFALYDKRVRDLADLKLYIDADPYKTCFVRRFNRDVEERGRSGESVVKQYFEQVLDGYKQFVEPTRINADMCYTNELVMPDKNNLFIKMVAEFILKRV